jgi:hypothetical protein
MRFTGIDTGLVLNKSRSDICMKETGSPRVSDWAKIGHIELDVGRLNGHYQLRLRRSDLNGNPGKAKKVDLDQLNEDLGLGS